jgi:hypothetical protein
MTCRRVWWRFLTYADVCRRSTLVDQARSSVPSSLCSRQWCCK